MKNQLVAICPELPENILTCQYLKSFLDSGSGFSDKSSIGRIRDSYVLKMFSLANYLDCMDKDSDLALMYLLPWALQEEII
jgi:hypothetical protein